MRRVVRNGCVIRIFQPVCPFYMISVHSLCIGGVLEFRKLNNQSAVCVEIIGELVHIICKLSCLYHL